MNDKKLSKARRICGIVSTAVVLAAFILALVALIVVTHERKTGGDVKLFGYYLFGVMSDSMEPTLHVGDVFLAKQVKDANALKEGDIITFTAPSGPIAGQNETHRIVQIVHGEDGKVKYFKTRGDAQTAGVDSWELSPSAVKARFVRVSPFITRLREFMSHWYGYVVVIAIPFALAIVCTIVGLVGDLRANKKS